MNQMGAGLKSGKEAASFLGICEATLRRHIKSGSIRAVYIGARMMISVQELERVATHGAGIPRSRKARIEQNTVPAQQAR